ncbi:amino acid adenylation domain-containing protein [Paenibacillus silvae]|uniref:non-ribosomal peptide synthetase n=1 Tax=Paenibacillus silvae TaxID=1325358 RepID=UPI003CEEF232
MNLNLCELLTTRAIETPDNISIISNETKLTYAELEDQSNQLAHFFIASGIQRGARICIAMPQSQQYIIAVTASIKAGGIYIPIDLNYPEERIRFMIEDTEPAFLIISSDQQDHFNAHYVQSIVFEDIIHNISHYPKLRPSVSIYSSDPAYIMYTSGTTGTPKGVVIPHRAIVHLALQPSFMDVTTSDVIAFLSSISFDSSTLEIWSALLNGATLAIPSPEKRTPQLVSQTVSDLNVTIMFLTPALLNLMVEDTLFTLTNLKYLVSGGDIMSPATAQQILQHLPNCILINGYGPTENTIFTTTFQLPTSWDQHNNIPIGRPVKGTYIEIVNDQGDLVPQGQIGELIASGDGLALGYWKREQITKERFINREGKTFYKTGDLVRLLEDGNLEFIGRKDNQVKIRGFRIELGEIEHILSKHPDIQSCIVKVAEVAAGDKRIIAYLVPWHKNKISLSEVQHFSRDQLPSFMCPDHYLVLEAFPMTHNGKIDRNQLQVNQFKRPELNVQYISPKDELQETVCKLWSDLLRVAPIGIEDNFFDLGGNSILAAKMLIQLRRLLQKSSSASLHHLPASLLYEYPTVCALCNALQHQSTLSENNFMSDIILDARIQSTSPFSAQAFQQNNVLLTGATGFLGAYLVREFIRTNPNIKLYCLVRARDQRHALQRIQVSMDKYRLWENRYRHNIVAIAGALEKPTWGLPREKFDQLAQVIDCIYHNGAMVNYVQSYTMHKETNVTGTQHILAFACAGRTKPVHFLSTIAVFGPAGYANNIEVISEDASLDQFSSLVQKDIGYSQSKWVAEQLVWEAKMRGIPVTVLRPGFIMGDSKTGASNTEDYMGKLIKGCIELGSYPDLPNQRKEFVPVDYVARAVIGICSNPDNLNRAYHLVPPYQRSLELNRFFEKVQLELGYELEKLSYSNWLTALIKESEYRNNALIPFLPMLAENVEQGKSIWELYENMPEYDSSNTQRALVSSGVSFPEMDTNLMKRYFNYMIEIGFLSAP